jgi:hypothetical protein
MTKDQEDAIYAAYLGICVLRAMTRKVGLRMATERAGGLLQELGAAFPFIGERVALSALRGSQAAAKEREMAQPLPAEHVQDVYKGRPARWPHED